MIKQKLHIELKNVPTDASQVRCSTSLSLNSGEGSHSAASKVLVCNNAEVNLSQQTGRSIKPFMFVLCVGGSPLTHFYNNIKKLIK